MKKGNEKIEIKHEVIKEVLPFLLPGSLHGVYGKAGSGKTTFCLHIVEEYINRKKKVVYIDTENGFFIERLLSISPSCQENLSYLLIKKVFDLNELRNVISQIRKMFENEKISLIIIDSLSNPYRVEFKDHSNVWEINRVMGRAVNDLKKIAFHHNIPILATHQVYVDFETGNLEVVGRDLVKYDFKIMIYLKRENSKRTIELVRHPFLSPREINVVIKEEGFKKKKFI